VFNTIFLLAQTDTSYTKFDTVACYHSPECKEGIILQVNTIITDNTSIECGEFDVEVSFDIIEGKDCIEDPAEDINHVRWYVGKNYSCGRNTTTHISKFGMYDLKLQFRVHTICGLDYIEELHYPIQSKKDCDGCYSAISYCDLFCNPLPQYNDVCDTGTYYNPLDTTLYPQIPQINSIRFFAYIQGVPLILTVEDTNNYGIFDFPYWARDENQCQNFKPGLIELVRDLNIFLNLSRTGDSQYETFSGYVTLMDSYGDITESGDTDLCKIRINFVDNGMFFVGFHNIKHYEFDFGLCDTIGYLDGEDEHWDTMFGFDQSCFIPFEFRDGNIDYSFEELSDDYVETKYNLTEDKNMSEGTGILKCMPSIVDNKIWVEWNFEKGNNFSISIYDITGKEIKSIDNIKNVNRLYMDISSYQSGIYFIKLLNKVTGESKIEKILKQ